MMSSKRKRASMAKGTALGMEARKRAAERMMRAEAKNPRRKRLPTRSG
jgi:hypothetical protein